MRRHPMTGLAVFALAAGTFLMVGAGPAAAAATTTLYVNNVAGSNCSDAGTGTQAQPYCTIGAAVAVVSAGQTVNVTGHYNEAVTIASSGSTGMPISLTATPGAASLSGSNARLVIDGQHDVSVSNISVEARYGFSPVSLIGSSRITLANMPVVRSVAGTPAIALTGVSDSSLAGLSINGGLSMTTGIALDSATTGVVIRSTTISGGDRTTGRSIDIAGSGNTVLDSTLSYVGAFAIVVQPGAATNVIANTYVRGGYGNGIVDVGGTGTAIVNNEVRGNCGVGIKLAGTASGASVQNNIVADNGYGGTSCNPSITERVNVGVYDGAVDGHPVIDYNTVYATGAGSLYAWNTPMDPAAFRAASGQSTHDSNTLTTYVNEDSANSAAPGYQVHDRSGNIREDDPSAANTGAGPIGYADRGATERVVGPRVHFTVDSVAPVGTVAVNAAASYPGWVPIQSYTFDFGDGTKLTQATPSVTHRYSQPGDHSIVVTVTDANNMTSTNTGFASCVPVAPATGAASRLRADFNGDGRDDIALLEQVPGGTYVLRTMTARDCGGFPDSPQWQWQGPGDSRIDFMTTGDFNGDGKADIAFLRDYGNGHVSIVTLTANASGDGGFGSPVVRWDAPAWGTGTTFVTTGDFNGDGRTDLTLFFDYSRGHVAMFTLTANASGDGGFGGPVQRWDAPAWGTGTMSVTTGDFNGDGRSDIGLFYSYSASHVALFSFTAGSDGAGTLGGPVLRWDAPAWGSGTRFVVAGDYNDDGRSDVALFFDYGGGHVRLFNLTAGSAGDGTFAGPVEVWDGPVWGTGTRFMVSGHFAGVGNGAAGLAMLYDYGPTLSLFTLYDGPPTSRYDSGGQAWYFIAMS